MAAPKSQRANEPTGQRAMQGRIVLTRFDKAGSIIQTIIAEMLITLIGCDRQRF